MGEHEHRRACLRIEPQGVLGVWLCWAERAGSRPAWVEVYPVGGGEYIGVCVDGSTESALFEEGGGGDHCTSELFREEYC